MTTWKPNSGNSSIIAAKVFERNSQGFWPCLQTEQGTVSVSEQYKHATTQPTNQPNQLTQRTHPCEIRALPKYYQPNSIKKCTPLWREAHFKVKMYKAPQACTTFGRWSVVLCGMGRGFSTLPKVSKTWGVCRSFKNDGRRGAFEEDLQRCIARGRRNTRDMFIRDVARSGRWFPEKGCILEHQIFRFAKMICMTGAALRMTWHHFFGAGAAL